MNNYPHARVLTAAAIAAAVSLVAALGAPIVAAETKIRITTQLPSKNVIPKNL